MKNWSYSTKNKIWMIAFPVILIAGYFLSFSKTLDLHAENKKLVNYESEKDLLPIKITRLNQEIKRLDSLISMNQSSYQSRLLNTLGEYCKTYETILIDVKGVEFKQYKGLQYETFNLKISGKYHDLVRMLDAMENNFGLGKVQSVNYLKETDRRSKRTSLILSLYLTRIKSENLNQKK